MNARDASGHIDPLQSPLGFEDYSPDEVEFIQAIEEYKRKNKRPFPTFREVLRIAISLGWRKVSPEEGKP